MEAYLVQKSMRDSQSHALQLLAKLALWAYPTIKPCLAAFVLLGAVQAVIYAETGCITGDALLLALQITPGISSLLCMGYALLMNAVGDMVSNIGLTQTLRTDAVSRVLALRWFREPEAEATNREPRRYTSPGKSLYTGMSRSFLLISTFCVLGYVLALKVTGVISLN